MNRVRRMGKYQKGSGNNDVIDKNNKIKMEKGIRNSDVVES